MVIDYRESRYIDDIDLFTPNPTTEYSGSTPHPTIGTNLTLTSPVDSLWSAFTSPATTTALTGKQQQQQQPLPGMTLDQTILPLEARGATTQPRFRELPHEQHQKGDSYPQCHLQICRGISSKRKS